MINKLIVTQMKNPNRLKNQKSEATCVDMARRFASPVGVVVRCMNEWIR